MSESAECRDSSDSVKPWLCVSVADLNKLSTWKVVSVNLCFTSICFGRTTNGFVVVKCPTAGVLEFLFKLRGATFGVSVTVLHHSLVND